MLGLDPASPCLGDSVATSIPSLTTPLGPHAADWNAEERAAPALDFAGEQKALWRFPPKRKGGKRPPTGGAGASLSGIYPRGERRTRGERARREHLGQASVLRPHAACHGDPPGAALCGRSERVRVGGAQRGPGWPAGLRPADAGLAHGRGPAARGRCRHRETRSRRRSPPARCSATRLCQSNGGDFGRLTVRPRPDAGRRGERVLSGVRAAVRPSVPILLETTPGLPGSHGAATSPRARPSVTCPTPQTPSGSIRAARTPRPHVPAAEPSSVAGTSPLPARARGTPTCPRRPLLLAMPQ